MKLPNERHGTEGGAADAASQAAPFPFAYVESQLRKKNFGVLTTITPQGLPHSAGVVYAVAPPDHLFCLYFITRPELKKARNISNNPNVSFVVPFPHYLFRMVPSACIQLQGKAKLISPDDPTATQTFQQSIVLRRSILYYKDLGQRFTFIRIIPDNKIFSFGLGASVWQFLMRSKNKNLGNFHVAVPVNRRNPE